MTQPEGKDGCPHEQIRFCPLYVESHNCRGLGCVDDVAKPCQVERRKMNYDAAVTALREVDEAMINEITRARTTYESAEQRKRNMRQAGIQ